MNILLLLLSLLSPAIGFLSPHPFVSKSDSISIGIQGFPPKIMSEGVRKNEPLRVVQADLDVVALVVGQENYGLAIVSVGEGLWSFLAAPSLSQTKVLIPALIGAVILVGVSGPMVTSGDEASVALGLEIATGVSVMLGASYVARLLAPYSPSSKEIAFLGLLVAIAGFFSFSQNLFVDGFIALPSIPLPTLPSISLPSVSLPSLSLPSISLPSF